MFGNIFSIVVPDERVKRFIYLHKIHKPNSNSNSNWTRKIYTEIPVAHFIQYESAVLFGCNIALYALYNGLGTYAIHLTINLIF